MISHPTTQHSTTQGSALAVSSWCLRGGKGERLVGGSYRGIARSLQLGTPGSAFVAIAGGCDETST